MNDDDDDDDDDDEEKETTIDNTCREECQAGNRRLCALSTVQPRAEHQRKLCSMDALGSMTPQHDAVPKKENTFLGALGSNKEEKGKSSHFHPNLLRLEPVPRFAIESVPGAWGTSLLKPAALS